MSFYKKPEEAKGAIGSCEKCGKKGRDIMQNGRLCFLCYDCYHSSQSFSRAETLKLDEIETKKIMATREHILEPLFFGHAIDEKGYQTALDKIFGIKTSRTS